MEKTLGNIHIEALVVELKNRKLKNSRYSLRAYARDLGLPASALSNILSGKKGLSSERAEDVAKRLELSRIDREIFMLSSETKNSRSVKGRKEALVKLQKVLQKKQIEQKIPPAHFEVLQSWHYLAILELMELPDCDRTAQYFSKKIGLSVSAIEGILEKLVTLKIVEEKDRKYFSTQNGSTTDFDVPSKAMHMYQRSILAKADSALDECTVLQREFISTLFAFNKSRLPEAKEMIREFQANFADKFYAKAEVPDSVYQISVQFFPLDSQGASI